MKEGRPAEGLDLQMAKKTKIIKPQLGAETKSQAKASVIGSGRDEFRDYNITSSKTYQEYREMRKNPTIALARIVATAPIRKAEWTTEWNDGVDDKWGELVTEQMTALWQGLIKDILLALDYGWSPFEIVWAVKDGKYVIERMKHLLVDKTDIQIDEYGEFTGLKQGDIELGLMKSFVFTNEGEAGNYYGRSRHENVRDTAWRDWKGVSKKCEQFFTKTAGTIPIINYPEGKSLDAAGNEQDNFDLAKLVLQNLGKGNGVAMPNVFAKYAEDLAKAGVDPGALKAWEITFLEDSGNHGSEFIEKLKHDEALMMRGWLVPERVAIEGQFGTKAESSQHTDTALFMAELTLEDILDAVNKGVVDKILELNFGQEAKGKVYLKQSGLSNTDKAYYRSLVDKLFMQSITPDFVVELVELDTLLDYAGVPKTQDYVALALPEPSNKPVDSQKQEDDINTNGDDKDDTGGKLSRLIKSFAGRFRVGKR